MFVRLVCLFHLRCVVSCCSVVVALLAAFLSVCWYGWQTVFVLRHAARCAVLVVLGVVLSCADVAEVRAGCVV